MKKLFPPAGLLSFIIPAALLFQSCTPQKQILVPAPAAEKKSLPVIPAADEKKSEQVIEQFMLPTCQITTAGRDKRHGFITISLSFHKNDNLRKELSAETANINLMVVKFFSAKPYTEIDSAAKLQRAMDELSVQINSNLETGKITGASAVELMMGD